MIKTRARIYEVCDRLTDVFLREVPLQRANPKGKKRLTEKEIAVAVESGLKQFYAAARAEREKYRLGVIARARVAFGLQQRLLDSGYPSALVKQVLFAMLLSAFVGKKN
jgi:hypothetical protein